MNVRTVEKTAAKQPLIIFTDDDFKGIIKNHDDPMVIWAIIANADVGRILVDQGSLTDILSYDAFLKMRFKDVDLLLHDMTLVAFTGDRITSRSYLETRLTLEGEGGAKTIIARFLVVDYLQAYNVILGHPTLNATGAIVSTRHLAMKFISDEGKVVTIHGNQQVARNYYNMSLCPIPEDAKGKRKREFSLKAKNINMVDLDPRNDTDPIQSNKEIQEVKDSMRLQPEGGSKSIQFGEELDKIVKIGKSLLAEDEAKLV